MEVVVYSHKHGLVPFYLRLQNQGAAAYLLVAKQQFEAALGGKVKLALRNNGEICPETLATIQEQVASGKATLVTDLKKHQFTEGRILGIRPNESLPSGPIRIGAWFDGNFSAVHLLVADDGVWASGLGPNRLGGLTMVLPRELAESVELGSLLAPVADMLGDFKGLVQIGLELDETTGNLRTAGIEAGWPWLHSAAFISELENFPQLVRGEEAPRFTQGKRFVVVLPVSIPPWPNPGRTPETKIEGLTPAWSAKFFWYDCAVRDNQLWSAGLDGLLGIARGAAGNFELARGTALQLARALNVPEKQFRTDVGDNVNLVLAGLERQFGVLI